MGRERKQLRDYSESRVNFDSNFEQEQAQAWDTRTSGTRTVETMAWDLTLAASAEATTVSSVSTDSNFAEDASERTPRTSVSRS